MCMHDSPSSQQDSISEDDIYSTPDEPMPSGDVPPLPSRVCRVLCNDCHHYPQYPVSTTHQCIIPCLRTPRECCVSYSISTNPKACCVSYPVSTIPRACCVLYHTTPLGNVVYHTLSPLSPGYVVYCIVPCIHYPPSYV